MIRRIAWLAGAAWLLAAHANAATDRQTRSVSLPAGRVLSLEITIGAVHLQGTDSSEATIEIVRHAPAESQLARIPVFVEESAAAVRVRCVQADGGTDPALKSDVTIRLPRAASGSIRILEGRLQLSALHGAVTAEVQRGNIEASDVSGTLRLETSIGDLIVDRARLSPAGLLRLRTFNGDVKLTLAERPPDARILALALNGTIASTIPLNMKDQWGPRFGEATLGKGEPVISIDVITGRIEIKSP